MKRINKKLAIKLGVALAVVAGLFGFWYYKNASFTKEILTLRVSAPTTASMGDEITYTVTYKNNSSYILQKPILTLNLPDNSLTEDSQTRLTQNVDDLNPGQQGTAQFKTRLLGNEGDVKTVQVGFSYVPQKISARYQSDTTFSTTIDTVPLTLDFSMPQDSKAGNEITYTLNYFSNIDYPLENMSIKIEPVNGFSIKSADPASLDNIEWKLPTLNKADGGKISIKGIFNANASGDLSFLAHLGMWREGRFIIVKDAQTTISLSGSSIPTASPSPSPNIITNSSDLTVTQKAYYTAQEGIENSGPLPPQVNAQTSYVIGWQLKNTVGALKNVKISAILPKGVTLMDNLWPDEQANNFSYDDASRQVVWLIGNLPAGSQTTLPSLYFQIALTPDESMKGRVANIMGRATISGKNASGTTISSNAPVITTNLVSDQNNPGGGVVE